MKFIRLKKLFSKIEDRQFLIIQEFVETDQNEELLQVYQPILYRVDHKVRSPSPMVICHQPYTKKEKEDYLDDFGPYHHFAVLYHNDYSPSKISALNELTPIPKEKEFISRAELIELERKFANS